MILLFPGLSNNMHSCVRSLTDAPFALKLTEKTKNETIQWDVH